MTAATGFITAHGLHLVELAAPVAWIAWVIARERRRGPVPGPLPAPRPGAGAGARPSRGSRPGGASREAVPAGVAVWALVVATVGAAAVHASIAPQHYSEGVLYGLFFTCLALGQLVLAGLIAWRRDLRAVAALTGGNIATIGLWLLTRLAGIPGGPRSGLREPFTATDIVASGFEVAAVVAAAVLLRRRPATRRSYCSWARGVASSPCQPLPASAAAPGLTVDECTDALYANASAGPAPPVPQRA